MKNKIKSVEIVRDIIMAIFCLILCIGAAMGQGYVDVETGVVFTGYNDVRIPGNQGTLFSLKDDLDARANLFYRLRASYVHRERHYFSLLYAPLTVRSEGTLDEPISYQLVTFQRFTPITAYYTFNSYRATYRYDFVKRPRLEFGLGFTAKIRDAEIRLESADISASKVNVGFVPIVNFRLNWFFTDDASVLLVGDALAAPQGRAEDILLAATYRVSKHAVIRAGYRILEGGADNDEVYNFALFHYATVGLSYKL